MGVVVHEAMIVTCWNRAMIGQAHDTAVELFGAKIVSPLLPEVTNTYSSFLIQPCGSKQGWGAEEEHAMTLAAMAEWLHKQAYEDGSNSLEWVAIRYGNDLDERKPHVIQFSQSKDPSQ